MQRNLWRIAIALAGMTAMPVYADLAIDPANRGALDFVTAVVTLIMQYWLTAALMGELGRRAGDRKIATVLGISLLSAVGIALGLILFIVPGIVLLVRWSISIPYALGENAGVVDAMSASFEETRGAFWPILLVLLTCYVPMYAAAAAALFLLEIEGPTLAGSTLLNLFINCGLIAGWHGALATYVALRSDARLSELFA